MYGLRSAKLRLEHQLTRGLPALDILRCSYNIAQWVHIMNFDIQSIFLNEIPQLLRCFLKLLARGDIVEQRRAEKLDVLR
jgi:hypothetical protein